MADPLRFCDVWPPCEPDLRPWYVVLGEGIAGPYGEQEDLLMAGEDTFRRYEMSDPLSRGLGWPWSGGL